MKNPYTDRPFFFAKVIYGVDVWFTTKDGRVVEKVAPIGINERAAFETLFAQHGRTSDFYSTHATTDGYEIVYDPADPDRCHLPAFVRTSPNRPNFWNADMMLGSFITFVLLVSIVVAQYDTRGSRTRA